MCHGTALSSKTLFLMRRHALAHTSIVVITAANILRHSHPTTTSLHSYRNALLQSQTAHTQLNMLAGKAALVTGSTSGIGLAMIKALAGAGANVAMHGLGDPVALKQLQADLAKEHGVKVWCLVWSRCCCCWCACVQQD